MKKVLALALAAASVAAMSISTMAVTPVEGIENCYYNYVCHKSVNEVVPDGVYNESEWSDAVELVINDDTLEDYGRWQTKGESLPADEYSWTYKFKWDENYFYVLEIRTDAAYVADFEGQDYAGNRVYSGDGTAIFFRDSALVDVDNTNHNICFFPYVSELGTASVYIGGDDDTEVPDFFGPSGESDITYGGTFSGNTTVFELKMSWDHMRDQLHLESDIAESTVFRFTPIIMNRDTIEDYNKWGGISDTYRQLNFHDCVRIPESGQTGVDVHYYAGLTLSAAMGSEAPAETAAPVETEAPVVETEAPAETEAPVVETEAPVETVAPVVETEAPAKVEAPAEKAPQTFDAVVIPALAAVVSLAGYAVAKKHRG